MEMTSLGIDQEVLRRFLSMSLEIDEKLEELSTLKAQRGLDERRLTEQFAAAGIQSINIDGATVFLRLERYANAKAECRSELVAWAREAGLDDMIVVQPQRFKSWCREQLDSEACGFALPPAIAGMVNIYEAASLRIRR